MGMMTYSPLAVGLLTGRFRRGETPPVDSAWTAGDRFDAALDEKTDQIIQQLVDIGEAQNKTPAQVAIAWILANDDVTAPIIGPDRPEHVEEVFGALDVEFSAEQLQALDELSQWQPLTRTH
jgi:aryl-alcohol dehydrogenase-like predicted oxidoreductase